MRRRCLCQAPAVLIIEVAVLHLGMKLRGFGMILSWSNIRNDSAFKRRCVYPEGQDLPPVELAKSRETR
jgi:hypothetical protein